MGLEEELIPSVFLRYSVIVFRRLIVLIAGLLAVFRWMTPLSSIKEASIASLEELS
jgi:hypothetical protein